MVRSLVRALGALGTSALLSALALLGAAPALSQAAAAGFEESFQSVEVLEDGSLATPIGRFIVEGEGTLEIMHPASWAEGELGLRLPGGTELCTVMEVAPSCAFGGTVEFTCQRYGRKRPFALSVGLLGRGGVEISRDLTDEVSVKEPRLVSIDVPSGISQIRFNVTGPNRRGVWIDDLRFVPPKPMRLESASFEPLTRPLVHGERVEIGELKVVTAGALEPLTIGEFSVTEHVVPREEQGTTAAGGEGGSGPTLLSSFEVGEGSAEVLLRSGVNRILVYVSTDLWMSEPNTPAWSTSTRYSVSFLLAGEQTTAGAETLESAPGSWPAVRLMPAEAEIDGVSLVTALAKDDSPEVLIVAISTSNGVTLKRSLDGGGTWTEPQFPSDTSGLREASLVYDIGRDKLHLLVESEGAMLHAVSETQGSDWSDLRTLGGLGSKRIGGAASSGIFVSTADLAVPCIYYGGFRIADEACTALLVSQDGGETWAVHGAAFANTSTASVVEIGPGALLVNMTDGRGAMRSERSTRNLGESWTKRNSVSKANLHLSAGSDGAMVHLGRSRGTGWDGRLVFANANTERLPVRNMTLKGSSDNTSSWPMDYRTLLDDGVGVDHPSLAPVGESEVGVAYAPSTGGVIFQRLPESVVVPKAASWFDVTGGR